MNILERGGTVPSEDLASFEELMAKLEGGQVDCLLLDGRATGAELLKRLGEPDPERLLSMSLAELEKRLSLTPSPEGYRPVVRRLGSRFLPSVETRPETPMHMPGDDTTFMRGELDLALEADLGYRY